MEKKKVKTSQALAPNNIYSVKRQFDRLHDNLAKAGEHPKADDVSALRQLLLANPEILPKGWTLHETVRDQMIERVTKDGRSRALMLAEVDRWLKELGYDGAPALERIHMENIVTCRLRLALLEFRRNTNQSSFTADEHQDRMLSSGHHRLNKAVESLAKVRLLVTRAPVFQINVATQGGKQVNLSAISP
jgi:hypothetical protein